MVRKAVLFVGCVALLLVFAATTNYLLRSLATPPGPGESIRDKLYARLREQGYIRDPKFAWEVHVSGVKGRTLENPVFKRRAADGNGFDIIASAKEAELAVDVENKQILVHLRQCNMVERDGPVGYVDSKIWPIELPPGFPGDEERHRAR